MNSSSPARLSIAWIKIQLRSVLPCRELVSYGLDAKKEFES